MKDATLGTYHKKSAFWSKLLLCLMGFLICACSTPSGTQVKEDGAARGVLQSVEAVATPAKSTIVIKAPGAGTDRKAYTLNNPSRICVDIAAKPAEDLIRNISLPEGPVGKIVIQDRGPGHLGLVVYVRAEEYKYRLTPGETEILLTVTPLGSQKFERPAPSSKNQADLSGPRIVNVAVIEKGAQGTRLSVQTDQGVENDVTLEGNILLIDLKNVGATPESLKALETTSDRGVIEKVRAEQLYGGRGVRLKVFLRALAPYHMVREGNLLMLDFEAVPGISSPSVAAVSPAVRPPGAPGAGAAAVSPPVIKPADDGKPRSLRGGANEQNDRARVFEATSRDYAGQRMSFDFVDTDIRNILKLLAEVANLNIVWGSDVEGKISMRLDNVPWDQALEMVLKPNGLTYQIEDEVLWVVPRSKLVDMEIAEKKRKGALMAAKRLQGVFEAKVVEFIVIRHRPVADIFKMLVGDPTASPPIRPILDIEGIESEEKEEGEKEKGKKVKIATMDLYLSYDSGTNMLIANGVRAKVNKVKELVAKLDAPEKQVMIETRIVEATTDFARDLGIQWQSLDGSSPGIERKWYNSDGTTRFDGSFSTNRPPNWAANIGLTFGWLTDSGLGSLALDASLALAQEDGKAKIISAPKVMTVNNGSAEVARGTVRYFPIRTQDTVDYKEIPALLSLTVTPTVSADNEHVTMKIEVTDNRELPATVAQDDEGSSESPPGRTEKKITSSLIVKTGETVVIGGIYQKSEINTDSGVPWLKDIPVLGYLFKADRKTESKTELLIFLTPTVVKGIIENAS